MKDKTKDILEILGIWLLVSIIVFVFFWAIGYVVTNILLEYQFFLRPENAHFTEYNTPIAITKQLSVQSVNHWLTLTIILIPILIVAMPFLYWLKLEIFGDD